MIKEDKSIDLLKWILSIFIINGHTVAMCFFDENFVTYGLVRMLISLAVPCFFLMSSYYFFSSVNSHALIEKIQRMVLLYLFWTLIITPFYGMEEEWITRGYSGSVGINIEAIKSYIIDWVLLGKVGILWYIHASIIGLIITYILIKMKTPNVILMAIVIILGIFLSMGDGWHGIMSDNDTYSLVWNIYISHCSTFRRGWTWGLLFGISGYLLRYYETKIEKINNKIIYIVLIVFYFLYAFEGYYLYMKQSPAEWGVQFTTLPFAIAVFYVVKHIDVKISDEVAYALRKTSSLNYFIHMPILIIYKYFYSPMLAVSDFAWAWLAFLFTFVFSTWSSTIIYWSSKKIKFLRKLF